MTRQLIEARRGETAGLDGEATKAAVRAAQASNALQGDPA